VKPLWSAAAVPPLSRCGARAPSKKRRHGRRTPKLASLAILLLLASCTREKPATERTFPNAPVILISIDTLRADHLPVYGYTSIDTPNISALAADGVVFDAAWSHCPMTLPSHVSMLTGLLPTEHGVRNNAGFVWDLSKHVSLPQVLAQRGYATGAAVSSYVLRGDTGMRAAFQFYDDAIDPRGGAEFADYQRPGDVTEQAASRWLNGIGSKPFFFFLHLYEPHVPYSPSYDADIASADAIVGRFLDALKQRGIYDKAILVLTSDHGEGLGDHGEQQHSILLYREALHVPLVVKLPGSVRKGERIAAPVGLNDIAPTLARLTRTPFPRSNNLFAAPASRNIYAETLYPYLQLGWSDLRALINERWYLIDGPTPELYDITADPKQTKNVLAENRRIASAMIEELRRYPPANAVQPSIDPEVAARLASLGYIGTVRTRPDPRSLPNPNQAIAILGDMQRAFALANERRDAEAILELQAILAKHPKMQEARIKLAEVLDASGRYEESMREYRAALASSEVVMPDLMIAMGEVALRAKKIGEAAEIAKVSRAGAPTRAAALEARVAIAHGNLREALAKIDEVERLAGRSVYGMNALRGEAYAQMERPQDAIAAYRKEIDAFPSNREAYARLAVVQFLVGDRAGLNETLTRLDAIDPALAQRTRETFGVR